MKKQFFYAALAITLMSSCSKDNDPVTVDPTDPTTPEVIDKKVALELGINAPAVTPSTRATGTVGGVDEATNLWKGQTLYIVAYDKGTTTRTIDTETIEKDENGDVTNAGKYIFDGLTFKAPTQKWDNATNGIENKENNQNISILSGDGNEIKAVYYNPTGNMDFYGYHIDDLTGTLDDETKTVSGITITGAEDLLGAKTKKVSTENYPAAKEEDINTFNVEGGDRGFSAWAARRNIHPILDFKHLLTRLTFKVTAAKESAAEWYWDTDNSVFKENKTSSDLGDNSDKSTAVKIKKISVKGVKNQMQIILDGSETGKTYPYAEAITESTSKDLQLQSRGVASTMETLTPTAPKVYDSNEANKSEWNEAVNGTYSVNTPVGESLMIPAGDTSISLEIELEQLVVDTRELDGTPKTYKLKTGLVTPTLDYTDILDKVGELDKFTAGYSYDITIKVYSFEEIKITAELTKWENGGNFDVDAE